MLREASVSDLKAGRVSKDDGYIVVAMRFYPRFLRHELRDEFISAMSPSAKLLKAFHDVKKRVGDHNEAFEKVGYEKRFELTDEGMENLERLAKMSRKQDVYLVCSCKLGDRCHREILMVIAKELFGAKTEKPKNDYPVISRRFAKGHKARAAA